MWIVKKAQQGVVFAVLVLVLLPCAAQAQSAPVIEGVWLHGEDGSNGTIEAQLNTEGLETTYYFETWTSNGDLIIVHRTPIAAIPGAADPQRVRMQLGIPGGEAYGVTATNSAGTRSLDKSAGEESSPPPLIEALSVSHITPTDATLEARIDDFGANLHYDFELYEHQCPPGSEPAECNKPVLARKLPGGGLGASLTQQGLSLDLISAGVTLHPDTEYTYALAASDEGGSEEAPSQTFVTPASPLPSGSVNELQDWVVSGSITSPRTGQQIAFPSGSSFSGSGELENATGTGSVTGKLTVPPFEVPLKLFGVVPVSLGMTLTQVGPIDGSVADSEVVAGDRTLTAPIDLRLNIASVTVLGLTIPTNCQTASPMSLMLLDNLTQEELVSGWQFAGGAAVPSFECEGGLVGQLFDRVLTSWLSGAGGSYSVSIRKAAL